MIGDKVGPLAGVRVLDMTRVLAGPHATRMLADLGADVVKVEPPDGDLTRFTTPKIGGMATYFVQQNVGKRNISLDLTRPEAIEIVQELAATSDVLVENFRTGVLDKLGLGAETLIAKNSRLIYASVNGYGQTGVWARRRAYAPVVGAEMGFTKSQGDARDGSYKNDYHAHADAYTALELASAVMAALYQRERTGEGQRVEVTLAETLLYVNEHVHNDLYDGAVDPNWVRSFKSADHPVVILADGSQALICAQPAEKYAFGVFAELTKSAVLATDSRFATPADRQANMASLTAEIAAWAATVPDAVELERIFAPHNLAVGQMRSVRDIAESEWARERGAIVEVSDRAGGAVRIPGPPWRFSAAWVGVRGDARYRGEDNRTVLAERLGYDDERLDALEREGVLQQRLPSS